jgi:hypothetical protein
MMGITSAALIADKPSAIFVRNLENYVTASLIEKLCESRHANMHKGICQDDLILSGIGQASLLKFIKPLRRNIKSMTQKTQYESNRSSARIIGVLT